MELFSRHLQPELAKLAAGYPVVTILGPRQSGKTTLARMHFPDYAYCSLEAPDLRRLAREDPRAFIQGYPPPVILDEIQQVPDLLSYIQTIVDERQTPGMFILTGSHQPRLQEGISQSLAGRTALLRLLPLSIAELSSANRHFSRDEHILLGGMPRLHQRGLDPQPLYRSYLQTYVERDLRHLINIKDLLLFETFLKLLAGRIGQVANLHSLSNEVGVSSPTLQSWLSVLEASFIVFRLPPYFENFGKRSIKSPKIYFHEVGLAAYLLGMESADQVARDPLAGALFENLVVAEAVKARFNRGRDPELYFFRDQHGHEVDLVHRRGGALIPIEIKSSMTWHSDFLKGIRYFQQLAPAAARGHVIYAGDLTPSLADADVHHFGDTHTIFS